MTITVRKDGAINIGKKNRTILGMRPGMNVDVTFDKGKAIVKPVGYVCSVCEHTSKTALNSLGICKECEKLIIEDIRAGKSVHIAESIAKVSAQRKDKVIRK